MQQNKIKYSRKEFEIGSITIGYIDDSLVSLDINKEEKNNEESDFSNLVFEQLGEYFNGTRREFSINLLLEGTDFELKTWNGLMDIPYGKTVSYQELAGMIDNPKACRAIGNANNKNPIAIIIPCHRVINKNGNIGGFALGEEIKRYLLSIEGNGEKNGIQ